MTTTEERLRITRPGSGVDIDPRQLMALRYRRKLERRQLSERIRDLGLLNDRGSPVTIGIDHLGKLETGQRKPSLDAFRALCAALECTPEDLMPGGPVVRVPKTARERQARLASNRELREFAIRYGLRYKNPGNGRVYYRQELREAYARYAALKIARLIGAEEDIAEAEAVFEAALIPVPRDPAPPGTGAAGNRIAS